MSKTVDDFYNEIEHAATVAAPLFGLFGWTYGLSDGKTPIHNELVETITELVGSVLNDSEKPDWDGFASVASGRFYVSYCKYEEERELQIKLELASATEFKEFK